MSFNRLTRQRLTNSGVIQSNGLFSEAAPLWSLTVVLLTVRWLHLDRVVHLEKEQRAALRC